MQTALDLSVGALATQYIVYVMVESRLLTGLREWLWRVPLAGQALGQIFSCPHCSAFWAGLLVLLLWWQGGLFWQFAWVCALASGGQMLFLSIQRLDPGGSP